MLLFGCCCCLAAVAVWLLLLFGCCCCLAAVAHFRPYQIGDLRVFAPLVDSLQFLIVFCFSSLTAADILLFMNVDHSPSRATAHANL